MICACAESLQAIIISLQPTTAAYFVASPATIWPWCAVGTSTVSTAITPTEWCRSNDYPVAPPTRLAVLIATTSLYDS